ncbi:hypothetical protein EH165_02585 [Nakamurella antarctica]|uniref:Uncharacterized protein n=1 Tax=Nakamurella antarctica TaxID=1902245 RepID=A0A3G8ZK94_9ACTN|nr:hypothetical protein [Nakamurella antarctica]AZI57207.1 hypothetical protein EH165_02585 [Nakamurella antarctica]
MRIAPEHSLKEMPAALSAVLATLSENLGPLGGDLEAMLGVLADDLTAAVPSFLGLTINVRVGMTTLTFSTMDPDRGVAVAASLAMPAAHVESSTRMTFYASRRRAFAALATDAQNWTEFTGGFDLDGEDMVEIPDPAATLLDFDAINQVLGVLMETGLSIEGARSNLENRTAAFGGTAAEMAELLLACNDFMDP